jgi:hypothetical protein
MVRTLRNARRNARGTAQGWYSDPYRLHVARWFSDGRPTALVRDAGVESNDPPPQIPFVGTLEPVVETEGALLHTSGNRVRTHLDPTANAIWEIFVSTGGD